MAAKQQKALDMGQLQDNLERATKTYKTARTNLNRASEAHEKAEQEYITAAKALQAGMDQLRASTKVV